MSTAPQTLPANFTGWDQPATGAKPPATLPANFNQWDDQKPAQPQAQGPDLETIVKKSLNGQPLTPEEKQFADQQVHANSAYTAQQYAKAGQMSLGGGGIQNIAAEDGPSLLRWLYSNPKIKPIVDAAIEDATHIPGNKTLKAAWNSFGAPITNFFTKGAGGGVQAVTGTEGAAANAAGAFAPGPTPPTPTYPGAPLPARPSPELLQSQPLATGSRLAPPNPSDALGNIPVREAPAMEAPAAPQPTPEAPASGEPTPPSGRTLSGDSALRQVLTGQDNANLLKIAKSRGINVTKEALLKPGTADNILINKIVDDFSPEELQEISAKYLENSRMGRHNFGDVGAEANKTMSLQTYFPELKIPQAVLNRTSNSIRLSSLMGK